MSITAFAFIEVSANKERDVLGILANMPGISDVTPLFGNYDMFVRIEIDDKDRVEQFISEQIRSIDGISGIRVLQTAG